MQKQIMTCVNLGMNRDIGISLLSEKAANYAFENHNIRITAVNDNTLYTITNEKGTKHELTIDGKFLGSCILNNYVIVFTKYISSNSTSNKDCIYRLEYSITSNSINSIILYLGNLNFDLNHPIEAIGYYESEEVQKVYWVDGINPNRFINIADTTPRPTNEYLFDFLGRINNIPNILITKDYEKTGSFLSGTILYFITYYNKYGIETCIVWQSDIQYISNKQRGANPDEVVSCTFKFNLNNLDTNYDYIRIYAIYRPGLNSVAEGRLVTELEITNTALEFYDYGINYQNYNAEDIHYLGGQNIIASTIDYKLDTLFLGDILLGQESSQLLLDIKSNLDPIIRNNTHTYEGIEICECPYIEWKYIKVADDKLNISNYELQINKSKSEITGFKYRELYRFGIQFMDYTGEWSSVIWIGDKYCDLSPKNPLILYPNPAANRTVRVLSDDGVQKCTGELCRIWKKNDPLYEGYYISVDLGGGTKIYQYYNSPVNFTVTSVYESNLSEAFYDKNEVEVLPIENLYTYDGTYIVLAQFKSPLYNFRNDLNLDLNTHYKAYRILIAETPISSRRILTQGVINPTMFNYKDRSNNLPYSINSWIFRPRKSSIEHKHYYQIPLQSEDNAEIQGVITLKLPGTTLSKITGNYDSFALVFAPNYLAGCRLWYKLFYYNSNSCKDYTRNLDKLTEDGQKGVTDSPENEPFKGKEAAIAIARDNLFLKDPEDVIPWHFTDYEIVSLNMVYSSNWGGIAKKTISDITEDIKRKGFDVLISENMLPTGDLYKHAWKLGGSADIWKYVGLAVAVAASIVASIFSFGAAAPAAAAAAISLSSMITASLLSAAGSFAVLSAIGASAAITAMAENDQFNENAQDIEKQLLYKGIKCINGGSIPERRNAANLANSLLELMFEDYNTYDTDKFYLLGDLRLGSDANFYIMGGRLTNWKEDEKDKLYKSDSFYIDESIVSLNTPDIEDIENSITLTGNYKLDLIGTIPIDQVSTDYLIYAEQGGSSNSSVIPGISFSTKDGDTNINGILNGYLYQDSQYPKYDESSDYKVPIQLGLYSYKTYMWNRNTSLSLWMPDLKIIDVYGEDVVLPFAKPTKKIFANYRYSKNTTYQSPYSIDIDDPLIYNLQNASIKAFNFYDGLKYYTGNVDTVILPQENYTILSFEGEELYRNEEGIIQGQCKDPIPLRYKSTPHIVIPIHTNGTRNILPTVLKELGTNIVSKYNLIVGDYKEHNEIPDILGFKYESSHSHYLYDFKLHNYSFGVFSLDNGQFIYWNENKDSSDPYIINSNRAGEGSNQYIYDYLAFKIWFACLNSEYLKEVLDTLIAVKNNHSIGNLLSLDTIGNYITFLLLDNQDLVKKWEEDINVFFNSVGNALGERTYYFRNTSGFISNNIPTVQYNLFKFERDHLKGGRFICLSRVTKREESGNTSTSYIGTPIEDISKIVFKKLDNFYYQIKLEVLDNNKNDLGLYDIYYIEDDYLEESPKLNDFNVKQPKLKWVEDSPYLFLGELVLKNFDYSSWHNGISDYALLQINWNICSLISTVYDDSLLWGDTYYQRWECLKTFPFSELEINSNVEVLSFMLESHTNLDGRSDSNKGTHNLINLRPSNTNIINKVYSLNDNFFTYKVLDDKFYNNKFGNQVIWSLSKSNLDNIDKWTNINALNTLLLDGSTGKINKIINVNDSLLVFQDSSISVIEYNLKAALSTYEGVPLLMGNTGKVTGYTKITDNIGCSNKYSIVLTDAGLFFIDNNKKTLYLYTQNKGINNIGQTQGFSIWFKENIVNGQWSPNNMLAFVTNYDSITLDLYIMNDTTCLVYNVPLLSFTSFMSYTNTPLLFNLKGKSFAFLQDISNIELWTLFEGLYNDIYGTNQNYSIEYRLNPSPYTDNLFTNYLYIADWTDPNTKSSDTNQFSSGSRFDHFDTVKAWNEYLFGELSANIGLGVQPLKTKFRIWKGDIPRDGDTKSARKLKGDRMRNPWIHLKFTKDNINNTKMTFHNLNVIYYN